MSQKIPCTVAFDTSKSNVRAHYQAFVFLAILKSALHPSFCTAGNDDTGSLWLTSHLRLPHIFAAAELATLQQTLCKQGPSGTPFLLQPFVSSPNLVEADPNPRLLTLGRLLTQGAKLNGSAKAAAVAATAIQHMMLVSVCRGFHTQEGESSAVGPWCCTSALFHICYTVFKFSVLILFVITS